MSTSVVLPAGEFTTQINGKQCTAIRRSTSTSVSEAAAATTVSTSAMQETATSSSQSDSSQSTFSTTTTPVAVAPAIPPPPATSTTLTTSLLSTTSTTTNVLAPAETTTLQVTTSSSSTAAVISATPASKVTTPTTSSLTSIPIAQSELDTSTSSSATQTATSNRNNPLSPVLASQTSSFIASATTDPAQDQSSSVSGISSIPKLQAGPIVGGVLGAVAFIALLGALILWFCRRRRRRRDSLLTPLTVRGEKSFYEIDQRGPMSRGEEWRAAMGYRSGKLSDIASRVKSGIAGIGYSLKSKVVGERSDTPSVNLNRGNSQFLDGPIPQHSRNNSVLSNTARLTTRDRLEDWWDRFTDNIRFKWRAKGQTKDPVDPFAAARSMKEQQANMNRQPDFSQLLGTDERVLQLQADKRRASLTSSVPNLGSLGLDFETHDPFADSPTKSKAQESHWGQSNAAKAANPFADPIPPPERSISKGKSYISDIRRSRGQSIDAITNTSAYAANSAAYRPPSTTVGSRYPSSIAPSRDSYRDTVFSAFSSNGRKGKGRSDPFDLERPELWRPKTPPVPDNKNTSTRPRGASIAGRESADMYPQPLQPDPLRMSSIGGTDGIARIASNNSYASKYSSGLSSLGDWGDPGPDLGSGISSNSSLRGNALNNGGGNTAGDARGGATQGSFADYQAGNPWDARREMDNMSPVSKASSKNGVGKAM